MAAEGGASSAATAFAMGSFVAVSMLQGASFSVLQQLPMLSLHLFSHVGENELAWMLNGNNISQAIMIPFAIVLLSSRFSRVRDILPWVKSRRDGVGLRPTIVLAALALLVWSLRTLMPLQKTRREE